MLLFSLGRVDAYSIHLNIGREVCPRYTCTHLQHNLFLFILIYFILFFILFFISRCLFSPLTPSIFFSFSFSYSGFDTYLHSLPFIWLKKLTHSHTHACMHARTYAHTYITQRLIDDSLLTDCILVFIIAGI